MSETSKLILCGDCCADGRNERFLRDGNLQPVFGDLLPRFQEADLVLANLESPLTTHAQPHPKAGWNFKAHPDCAKGLHAAGIHAVGLANNHILDYGTQGLKDTQAACKEAGIVSFGTGEDREQAFTPLLWKTNGQTLGLLAIAEHEFSLVSKTQAGAAGLEPGRIALVFKRYQSQVDHWIILLHGGLEYYPYPTPKLQDTCRLLADLGASIVLCQHSHIAGCIEHYHDSLLVYGQGNFLTDDPGRAGIARYTPRQNLAHYQGMLVTAELSADSSLTTDLLPLRQLGPEGHGVRIMQGAEKEDFLHGVQQRSQTILKDDFVDRHFQEHVQTLRVSAFGALFGHGLWRKRLDRRLHTEALSLRDPERRRSALHQIRCESHREVLISLLDDENKG